MFLNLVIFTNVPRDPGTQDPSFLCVWVGQHWNLADSDELKMELGWSDTIGFHYNRWTNQLNLGCIGCDNCYCLNMAAAGEGKIIAKSLGQAKQRSLVFIIPSILVIPSHLSCKMMDLYLYLSLVPSSAPVSLIFNSSSRPSHPDY